MDHYTTIPLRAGQADDVLRIPLLEGEHLRAERNHGIGVMTICGTDIRRDLPAGSHIEITLLMDQSQQVRLQAFVPALEEDFEVSFDPQMKHQSPAELRAEADRQQRRLAKVQAQAESTAALPATAPLARIAQQQLLPHIASLLDAARYDPDAVAQLDRRLRELAAAVDDVEDAVEWPLLLERAETERRDTEQVVEKYGEHQDCQQLQTLTTALQRAIGAQEPALVRRAIDDLIALYFAMLNRQPGYHVGRFEWLVEQHTSMRDQAQAEQLIAQGRRAITHDDLEALKAANRQLRSLLPRHVQEQEKHENIGDTNTGHA